MAIYLQLDGIQGNVTANGYGGHFAILSMRFGVRRSVAMAPGNMANREIGKPTISEITLTKAADSSVATIFKYAVSGSTGIKATLKFVRTGSSKLEEFMVYTLENCLVSEYKMLADDEIDGLVERIKLSFSKLTVSYKNRDASNRSGNPQRVGYDLITAKSE